jgi:hypothetical protein
MSNPDAGAVATWTVVRVDAGCCCICSLGLQSQDIQYRLTNDYNILNEKHILKHKPNSKLYEAAFQSL